MTTKKHIALMSDFGAGSIYTGLMKGVIRSINPGVEILDLFNDIAPQDIRQAAFLLNNSYRYYPEGTIFICVVDPGVGSERKCIGLQCGNYYFIGPDNGIFTLLIENGLVEEARELNNKKIHLRSISSTFHGRDIFAPAAAHLSLGLLFSELGDEISVNKLKTVPMKLSIIEDRIIGKIIFVDDFGNLITNISENDLNAFTEATPSNLTIHFADALIRGMSKTYTDVKKGDMVAYIGSFGFLEIGINQGNAAAELNLSSGKIVTVNKKPIL